ncbi:MAG: leucyl aminopeptidase family protein [Steroidobacteraceae bacterium]
MFFTEERPDAVPIHLVHEEDFGTWLAAQDHGARTWLNATGFRAERQKLALVPSSGGAVRAVVLGVGKRSNGPMTLWQCAGLADRIPDGSYYLDTKLSEAAATQFCLGWAYGQYRYERYRRGTARNIAVHVPAGVDVKDVERLHAALSHGRDLINTPAGDLTPEQLANAALAIAQRYGAETRVHVGDELLKQGFPAVHAVGRASESAPRVIDFTWGQPSHPRVSLVGKGVCFDSGGLDIKPPQSMLLMKKDMGGAACTIALAQVIMDAQLPLRLRVVIPAVENAISSNAYRPGDVLKTRKGLTVEVGNTDAEGRLVLADALTLADADRPELLIDMATLTGAARVALGPELPALFTPDDALAQEVMAAGVQEADPMWHMPLWAGYDDELASKIADLNNVSTSGFSGAIIGGLFLRRFVNESKAWMHLDLYAWNSKDRPGRPVGAEAQCVRALYALLKRRYPKH